MQFKFRHTKTQFFCQIFGILFFFKVSFNCLFQYILCGVYYELIPCKLFSVEILFLMLLFQEFEICQTSGWRKLQDYESY